MMRFARRQYLIGSVAALGGVVAAACDLGAEPPATTQSKPAVAIRVLTTLNAVPEALDIIWEEIGTRFAEEQPHLTLERHDFGVLGAPWDQRPLREFIRELIAAGELADVFQSNATLTGFYFTEGALLGLSDYAKRDNYDLTDYWPAVLAAAQWQGELLALPIEISPQLLYCNAELFAQAGVPIPAQAWSWEDFLVADRYGAAALATLGYTRHVPPHPQLSDLLDVFEDGLQPVWTGEQSVAAATAEIARRQNELLAKGLP